MADRKFTTFDDVVEYVEAALGEHASDFDVDGLASAIYAWTHDGEIEVSEDDFWTIAEKYDCRI